VQDGGAAGAVLCNGAADGGGDGQRSGAAAPGGGDEGGDGMADNPGDEQRAAREVRCALEMIPFRSYKMILIL
jgi:hypothetical protein